MLENADALPDDIISELYLDAIDNEASSKEDIISEDEKYELHEFQSSVCIWNQNSTPFQLGVYSQFFEARVLLNNCPKCQRNCRYPERKNLHVKKTEETILTCQIANAIKKKQCSISFRPTDQCICGNDLIQSKSGGSSYTQTNICNVCKSRAKCTTLLDHKKSRNGSSEILSSLKGINKTPTSQKYSTTLTSWVAPTFGNTNCRIPVKCGCKSPKKNQTSVPFDLSKLSYFSSEELLLVPNNRVSDLTETSKNNQCIVYDKFLGSCNCRSLKEPAIQRKCRYCTKHISSSLSSEWKNNSKHDNSMSQVVTSPIQMNLQCICGNKINRRDSRLSGIIEEVRPRPKSISTLSLVRRSDTLKLRDELKSIPNETSRKNIEEGNCRRKIENGKRQKLIKTDQRSEKQRDIRKAEINEASDFRLKGTKPPEILKSYESNIDERKNASSIQKEPENIMKTKLLKRGKDKMDKDIDFSEVKEIDNIVGTGTFKQPKNIEDNDDGEVLTEVVDQLVEGMENPDLPIQTEKTKIVGIKGKYIPKRSEYKLNISKHPVLTEYDQQNINKTKIMKDLRRPKDKERIIIYGHQSEKKYPKAKHERQNGVLIHERMTFGKSEDEITSNHRCKLPENLQNSSKASEDNRVRMADVTITTELNEDNGGKYSVEKGKNGDYLDYTLVQNEHIPTSEKNLIVMEPEKKPVAEPEDKCHRHDDKLPVMVGQKCKSCKTKYENCSRIPMPTSKYISKFNMPKNLTRKKLSSNISTNTDRIKMTEKAEQWENENDDTVILDKQYGQSTDKASVKNNVVVRKTSVSNQKVRCRAMGSTRSSTSVRSKQISDKLYTPIKNASDGSKYYQRPSTANKIYDLETRQFDQNYKSGSDVSGAHSIKSSEEALVRICQLGSELLSVRSEKDCPPKTLLNKNSGKISHYYTTKNTDQENSVVRSKDYVQKVSGPKTIKCKQCCQTGGTVEQDMIASYVASCSSNPNIPPPQQFIIQTLLYQFAGYDLGKDESTPRSKSSLNRSQSPQPSEHVMRSIQVQVGHGCPPKCETAQTVTTFILTDPRTFLQPESLPTGQGKINYVCGPNVPGIRTKVALNLNQIPSVNEEETCICQPDCLNEQSLPLEQYDSSICPHPQNENFNGAETTNANCNVMKNDKYVFITVTPVQTEPYEPNYYIIFTSPEDEAETKSETKNNKTLNSSTKLIGDKTPKLQSTKKFPLDRFKNQRFSLDTLKSSDFFDYFKKQPDVLRNTKVLSSSCDSNNPSCLVELLKKTEDQTAESSKIQQPQKNFEDKECGPDTCQYRKGPLNKESVGLQKSVKNRGYGPQTCEYFDGSLKNDKKPKELQKVLEDEQCGSDPCGYLEAPQEKEPTIRKSGNEKDGTMTVLAGPENCRQQDELNKLKSRNSNSSSTPGEPQGMQAKHVQCGPDTCSLQKKTSTNDNFCISTQTEEIAPTGMSLNKSPRATVVIVGYDIGTMTDTQEEIAPPKPEYCDRQVCTNKCEKGDAASQVCMGENYCEPDVYDTFYEASEERDDKTEILEVIPKYCDSSCGSGGIEEVTSQELLCDSNCDPSVCDSVSRFDRFNQSETEPMKQEECDDRVCPEKTTMPTNKLRDESVNEEQENYPKKIVNTKLDDQDVIALKLAMDRYIKIKPNLLNDE